MIIFFRNATSRFNIETRTGGDIQRFFSVLSNSLSNKTWPYIALRPDTEVEAMELLAYFIKQVKDGSEIPLALQNFLVGAFEKIVNGDPKDKELASKSLCLNLKRRGRPRINEERDKMIGKEVSELILQGSTLGDALSIISDRYHMTESNTGKIHIKFKMDQLEETPF